MSLAVAKPRSAGRQILDATILIACVTGMVRLLLVGRDLALSSRLGTSDAVDAFLVASALPLFLVSVLTSAFAGAVIPSVIRVRESEGQQASLRMLGNLATIAGLVLALVSLLVALAAPLYVPWIGGEFSPEKTRLTLQLQVLLAPMLVAGGIAGILKAGLNAEKRFFWTALSPAAPALGSLGFFLLLEPVYGIHSMAWGLLAGATLEAILLATILRRLGLRIPIALDLTSPAAREVGRHFVPILAGALLMGMTTFVNQMMAARLDSGSVAALNYANKIITLPQGIAVTALGMAVVPFLSQMAARRDFTALQSTIRQGLRGVFAVSVPGTLLLIAFSTPIVRLVFERGLFSAQDTELVARVQSCFALQIPFYMASIFVVRAISALQINRLLVMGSAINLAVNITLNLLLVRVLGVAGIALSTSCVYLVSFLFLYGNVRRHLARLPQNLEAAA
ncbi:MAG TPA: lipid II flippase MurJ [Fimbriimonadaceae bacterium]|nr:lipid II flippase MurJ [Fimbriimonadaceae bacterium]